MSVSGCGWCDWRLGDLKCQWINCMCMHMCMCVYVCVLIHVHVAVYMVRESQKDVNLTRSWKKHPLQRWVSRHLCQACFKRSPPRINFESFASLFLRDSRGIDFLWLHMEQGSHLWRHPRNASESRKSLQISWEVCKYQDSKRMVKRTWAFQSDKLGLMLAPPFPKCVTVGWLLYCYDPQFSLL